MKKITLLIALLVVGFSAEAAPGISEAHTSSISYGEPFIFVERNVEFAVYPDGQFDFLYNPSGKVSRINPRLNMSYNAGYNYNPFVQYDDFGAVIQIERVPVYYDHYGRIIQAGGVLISYNSFGRISRIGNMMIHYNPYNQYTHFSGIINRHNIRYVPQPWHHFYMPPQHYTIVYHQPYRSYYYPIRVKYTYHKNSYAKNYSNGYQKSYYRPGDNVVAYHRGRRTETVRDLREGRADYSPEVIATAVRSNVTTVRDKSSKSTATPVKTVSNTSEGIRDSRAVRTSTPAKTEAPARTTTAVRGADAGRNVQAVSPVSRSSSSNVQRTEVPAAVKRADTGTRSSVRTSTTTNEGPSTSRSSRGRG